MGLTDGQTDWLTNWWMDRLIEWLMDKQLDWLTDWQTDWNSLNFSYGYVHSCNDMPWIWWKRKLNIKMLRNYVTSRNMQPKAFFIFMNDTQCRWLTLFSCMLQLEWIPPNVTYIFRFLVEKHFWNIYKILNQCQEKLHLHLPYMFTLKDRDFDPGLFLVHVNQT